MNTVQQVLISAIHAGALELTKPNAEAVLELYRAMKEFIDRVPMPDAELLADYKAVEHWLFFAMRKGMELPDDVTDEQLRELAIGVPDNVMAVDPFAVLPFEFRLQDATSALTEGHVVREQVSALKSLAEERGLTWCEFRDEASREYVWRFNRSEA